MCKFEASETGSYVIGSHPSLPHFDIFIYEGTDLDAAKAAGFSYFSSMASFMESYGLTFLGSDADVTPPPSLAVSPTSMTFTGAGGTQTLTVTTAAEKFSMGVYSAGSYFCKASVSNKTITVKVAENTSDKGRSTIIGVSVGSQVVSIPVVQGAAVVETTLSVAPTSVNVSAAGASSDVSVTTNAQTWSSAVVGSAPWCTVTNGAGKITIASAANTSTVQRTATVRVTANDKTADIPVTQAAAEVTLSLSKTSSSLSAAGASDDVTVTTNAATWTAAVEAPAATWCTVAKGTGKITITASANTAITSRTATVRVTAEGKTADVTVTQQAAEVTLSVAPSSLSLLAAGETTNVTVTSNTDFAAAIQGGASVEAWLSIVPSSNQGGGGTVEVTVGANTETAERSATVRLTAGSKTVDLPITQAGATAP